MPIQCDECGSSLITKAGWKWRVVDKEKHLREKVQRWRCKHCGKLFLEKDGVKSAE